MPKDAQRNRTARGLVLSLREHPFLQPEFEPHRVRSVFKRLELFLGLLVVALLVALLVTLPPLTQANVATYYPQNCLGGWENSNNASGAPSLSLDEALAEDFTKDNSASLRGTAQIYCGDFKGEIPQKSIPTKMTIRLSWSVDDGQVVHRDPLPVVIPAESLMPAEVGQGIAEERLAPILEIIDANLEVPQVYPDVDPAPAIEQSAAPEQPLSESLQSFLIDLFATQVYAEEDLPIEVAAPAPAVEVNPAVEAIESEEVFTPTDPSIVEGVPAGVAEPEIVATNFATEDYDVGFVEVLYTINGADWSSLGSVNRNNWRNVSFDIPVSEWINLSKLQVSLRPIANIDPYPVVYLDAMILDVYYDEDKMDDTKEPFSVVDIIAKSDDLGLEVKGGFKDPIQLVIRTPNTALGNMALFDIDTGKLVLNTWTDENTYVVDPEYLGAGRYAVIVTGDPDACSVRTFDQCAYGSDALATATFVILKNEQAVPWTVPDDQTVLEEPEIDTDLGGAGSVPSDLFPEETFAPNVSEDQVES